MVDRGPAGAAAVRVGVEQRRGDVEPNGIASLRESGDSLRPERLWRETFLDRDRHPGPSCVRSQTTARRNGSQLRRVEQPMRTRPDAGARFPAGAGPMYDEPRYGPVVRAPGVELVPPRLPRTRRSAGVFLPVSLTEVRDGCEVRRARGGAARDCLCVPRDRVPARSHARCARRPAPASEVSTWDAAPPFSPASSAARSGRTGASSASTRAPRCWRRRAPGSRARVWRTAWRSSEGDAARLPFPAAAFDFVTAVQVYLYVPDVEGALAEAAARAPSRRPARGRRYRLGLLRVAHGRP